MNNLNERFNNNSSCSTVSYEFYAVSKQLCSSGSNACLDSQSNIFLFQLQHVIITIYFQPTLPCKAGSGWVTTYTIIDCQVSSQNLPFQRFPPIFSFQETAAAHALFLMLKLLHPVAASLWMPAGNWILSQQAKGQKLQS